MGSCVTKVDNKNKHKNKQELNQKNEKQAQDLLRRQTQPTNLDIEYLVSNDKLEVIKSSHYYKNSSLSLPPLNSQNNLTQQQFGTQRQIQSDHNVMKIDLGKYTTQYKIKEDFIVKRRQYLQKQGIYEPALDLLPAPVLQNVTNSSLIKRRVDIINICQQQKIKNSNNEEQM